MPRDPKYDILFSPLKIGPKTIKNRFYQVPHCDAMGYTEHHGDLHHRIQKAKGGWGVISTEQCSIHPTSCVAPAGERRLWDRDYAYQLAHWVDTLHEYDVLCAVELTHNGLGFSNRKTKEYPLGPSTHQVLYHWDPIMGREMDKADIKEFRRWQVDAAKRAVDIGFDIVYVYAAHNIALPQHFLSRQMNRRTDEYGGSVENRARLIGELLEDTKAAVGDRAAVALRFAVDDCKGPDQGITWQEEGQAVVEMFSDLPDLWDVNISDWSNDSQTSRFSSEGFQEKYISFVKQKTSKPVVSVGRFTSPDTMVSQIERGITDLIGAARPSIADPYLPKKIEEGRNEDIRECIGCNICVASENISGLFRCTQNPTAGEEWRRSWSPEEIERKQSDDTVLVVGSGPSGLECARALGLRGYDVHLVEARKDIGGRVAREAAMPGLAAWGRVADYRRVQIGKMKNVEVHTGVKLSVEDVLDYGADVVVIATGATWRKDGVSHANFEPIPGSSSAHVYTADDVMDGVEIRGQVVVFDDDHYYLGPIVAEKLKDAGCDVTIVTPLMELSRWSENTLEMERIMRHVYTKGIKIVTDANITNIGSDRVSTVNVYSGATQDLPCTAVVMVASRLPNDGLYKELVSDPARLEANEIRQVLQIGDCVAPSTIQHAVYTGHKCARELNGPDLGDVPYKLEHLRLEKMAPSGG